MLKCKIEITDLSDIVHTLYPHQLGGSEACVIKLREKKADDFWFSVEDTDGSVRGWLEEGCIAKFYVDDTDTPSTLVLTAMVEDMDKKQLGPNLIMVDVEGREHGVIKILQRVVIKTYQDTEISEIVKDLINSYTSGIGCITYVNSTGVTLEDKRFAYKPLKECLDELAQLCGFTYYIDPGLELHWFEEKTQDSGLSYDENSVDAPVSVLKSLIPTKNVVHVIGGEIKEIDQKETAANASVDTCDYWYAQSFTSGKPDLSQVDLYLEKTGSPDNLWGEIREDDGGSPGSKKVKTFIVDSDFVDSSAGWIPISINADILVNTKYWIVLKKTGDASNYYSWYHDNGSGGENAYSSDGSSWTVQSSSYLLAYKTEYDVPILSSAVDSVHKDKYEYRETVIRDDTIQKRGLARDIANKKLEALSDSTPEIKDVNIITPSSFPTPGEYVAFSLPDLGITDTQFIVREVTLPFRAGRTGTNKIGLTLGREISEFVEWLADLKTDVEKMKKGEAGVSDEEAVDIYRWWTANCVLSGVLDSTVKTGGTFEVGTAEVGFSDVG